MDQDKHAESDQPDADRSHRLRVCSPEPAEGGLGLSEYQYYEFLAIDEARAELAAGDRRLLYLAWLLSAGAGEVADDELEPAVPAGLASLSPSLRAVSDFLHVDGDLLAAAAEPSEPLGAIEPSPSELS